MNHSPIGPYQEGPSNGQATSKHPDSVARLLNGRWSAHPGPSPFSVLSWPARAAVAVFTDVTGRLMHAQAEFLGIPRLSHRRHPAARGDDAASRAPHRGAGARHVPRAPRLRQGAGGDAHRAGPAPARDGGGHPARAARDGEGGRGGDAEQGGRRAPLRRAVPDPLWQRLLGAASVRVWHLTSRRWGPWTERPLPEVVRVAYPRVAWGRWRGRTGPSTSR